MFFHLILEYWWAVLIALAVFAVVFTLFVTRGQQEAGAGERAKLAWARWRRISNHAANFQARVILTVFYFTFVAPFGLMLSRKDTLRARPGAHEGWLPRTTRDRTLADARKQF
ncbi:MAG: hypothetical protein IT307_16510 [Chloroflexi bacterium]|nr:hypothetical protein [Chloroflexota bacterium]